MKYGVSAFFTILLVESHCKTLEFLFVSYQNATKEFKDREKLEKRLLEVSERYSMLNCIYQDLTHQDSILSFALMGIKRYTIKIYEIARMQM